jgi:hypothetical protein
MRQLFRKIPGFSLMEVLFNMILIVIVISCGYLGYEYAFNDLALFNNVNTEMNEFVQFNNAFVIDQSRCSLMKRAGDNLILESDSVQVQYVFEKSFVVRRKQDAIDTFRLSTISFASSYDKRQRENGIVEEGILVLECIGKKLISGFSKRYDSYQLIKADSLSENGNTFR